MFKKYVILFFVFSFVIPQLDWKIYLDMFPNIRELARVESSFNPNAKNPKDTDGRPKYGLLQYGWSEFRDWSKEIKLLNTDGEVVKPDISNPIHQIIVARWASENNLLKRWGTYKKLVRSGKIILD